MSVLSEWRHELAVFKIRAQIARFRVVLRVARTVRKGIEAQSRHRVALSAFEFGVASQTVVRDRQLAISYNVHSFAIEYDSIRSRRPSATSLLSHIEC